MRISAIARAMTVSLLLVVVPGQSAASAAPVCGENVNPLDVSPAYIVENCPDWVGTLPGDVLELADETADAVVEAVQPFLDPALCVADLGLNVTVNGVLNCHGIPSWDPQDTVEAVGNTACDEVVWDAPIPTSWKYELCR